MNTHVQTRIVDRTGWDAGPWDDEPDRIQWTDEATGLPCLILRNRHGAWCGYVGVALDHPWARAELGSDIPADIHGGVTYHAGCDGDPQAGICHIPEPGQPDHAFWIGFDCQHAYDYAPGSAAREREYMPKHLCTTLGADRFGGRVEYRDERYVRAEVRKLAAQAKGAA